MVRVRKRQQQQVKPKAETVNQNGRTITTTPANRKADVSKYPYTGSYMPIPHVWFQQPNDLPPFSFRTVQAMLMDEGIRLNFATRAAPLHGLEFGWYEGTVWNEGVKCKDPAVASFIYRQIQRIWKTFLPGILRAQVWGWSAGEVTLKLSEETGLVEINEMLPRHAMDCKLLKVDCEKWGVQINRVKDGTVNLPFPYSWFHSYGAEDGEDYGTSAAFGAYSPWADKWFDGGAKDVRRLFMHKDAYGGADLGYPDGETYVAGLENPVPNRDIARQIVEQIRSGGVTTRPSAIDENGNEKWPLTRATVASNPTHILEYPKDLDAEIRHGMEIPDDVINSGTTGSWNGKAIPMQSFYASLDGWAVNILRDLCVQIIDHLLVLNFGKKIEYETPFKPLAKQAMEQQNEGEQQEQSGVPQDSPNAVGMQYRNEQPLRLSLIEQVGSGEIDVTSILEAGKIVVAQRVDLEVPALDTEETNPKTEPSKVSKFSSTQFNLPLFAAQVVRNIASRIPDEALASDGREDEPHITIKYGLHTDNPDAVRDAVVGFPPVRVVLGKASVFTGEEHDVVKIDVDSHQLHELNRIISEAVEHTDTYPDYKPHLTLAYVKPGLGEGVAMMLNGVDGTEIFFEQMTFSDKERNKTTIDLAPVEIEQPDPEPELTEPVVENEPVSELAEPIEEDRIVSWASRLIRRMIQKIIPRKDEAAKQELQVMSTFKDESDNEEQLANAPLPENPDGSYADPEDEAPAQDIVGDEGTSMESEEKAEK